MTLSSARSPCSCCARCAHLLAARQAVAERHGEPFLDPVLRIEVERIAKHHRNAAVRVAHRDARAPRRFGVGDQIERRPARPARCKACAAGRTARRCFPRSSAKAPASSKIGMYMRTTTPPIARPSTAIRTGSKALVNHSTVRAVWSSWKRAICASICPMSPLLSPTTIMRVATGVASPTAPSAATWRRLVQFSERQGKLDADARPAGPSPCRARAPPGFRRSSIAEVRYRRAS